MHSIFIASRNFVEKKLFMFQYESETQKIKIIIIIIKSPPSSSLSF
jgi:hypothetical protein